MAFEPFKSDKVTIDLNGVTVGNTIFPLSDIDGVSTGVTKHGVVWVGWSALVAAALVGMLMVVDGQFGDLTLAVSLLFVGLIWLKDANRNEFRLFVTRAGEKTEAFRSFDKSLIEILSNKIEQALAAQAPAAAPTAE